MPPITPSASTKRQAAMRKELRQLVTTMPLASAEAVLNLASAGHLRHLPPSIAVWQALTSHVRHEWTDYDELLSEGYDRDAARFFVLDAVNQTLTGWGGRRFLSHEEEAITQESESIPPDNLLHE